MTLKVTKDKTDLEVRCFLNKYNKTITLCKGKYKIEDDEILEKINIIIEKQEIVDNIEGYIYVTLKNLYIANYKKIQKEKMMKNKILKQNAMGDIGISKFHSDLEFYDLLEIVKGKEDREILRLRFEEGFTIRKIAQTVNKPKSTVFDRIKKAQKQIAQRL